MSHINQGAAQYNTADLQGTNWGWQKKIQSRSLLITPLQHEHQALQQKIKPREPVACRGLVLQGACAW